MVCTAGEAALALARFRDLEVEVGNEPGVSGCRFAAKALKVVFGICGVGGGIRCASMSDTTDGGRRICCVYVYGMLMDVGVQERR